VQVFSILYISTTGIYCRHYTEPKLSNIQGLDTFDGEVLHSHHYRSPSAYKNKIVLILGAGPSGVDIAADLIDDASKVSIHLELFPH